MSMLSVPLWGSPHHHDCNVAPNGSQLPMDSYVMEDSNDARRQMQRSEAFDAA